jgi:hypothetical protein
MTATLPLGTTSAVRRNITPPPERELPRDPVQWVRDDLDEHPWSVQRRIMRSVVEHRRTAVPSAHETGKTYSAARIAAWWIASHPLGQAKVLTSAPNSRAVKDLLWGELVVAHRKAGLPGTIRIPTGDAGACEWALSDGTLIGIGRKPPERTDLAEARTQLQGYHARYMLVILDEATGVSRWIWEAAQSLMGNEGARILAIGNPDDGATRFGEVCSPGSGWNVIPVSVFDTPAFTGEPVPQIVMEHLVGPTWVKEAEEAYGGKDNPVYQSKVLGKFPDTAPTKVISPKMIREAWTRDLPGTHPGAFGVDIARTPRGDHSAIYRVRGGVARLIDTWRGLPLSARSHEDSAVARVLKATRATPAVPVIVDNDGLGVGLADALAAVEEYDVPLVRFSATGSAYRHDVFDSRRSELWWLYRQKMERGEVDLDPADEQLAAQLQQPKWTTRADGRIHVETKDEMSKRGLGSPDRADAVIMGDTGAPRFMPERGPMGEVKRPPPRRPKPMDRARAKPGEGQSLRTRPL